MATTQPGVVNCMDSSCPTWDSFSLSSANVVDGGKLLNCNFASDPVDGPLEPIGPLGPNVGWLGPGMEKLEPIIGPGIGPDIGPGIGPAIGPAIGTAIGPAIAPIIGPIGPGIGPDMGPDIGPDIGPIGPGIPALNMGPGARTGPDIGPRGPDFWPPLKLVVPGAGGCAGFDQGFTGEGLGADGRTAFVDRFVIVEICWDFLAFSDGFLVVLTSGLGDLEPLALELTGLGCVFLFFSEAFGLSSFLLVWESGVDGFVSSFRL